MNLADVYLAKFLDYLNVKKRTYFPSRLYDQTLIYSDGTAPESTRRALLAYITHPFTMKANDPASFRFSNIGLARAIRAVLQSLGYVVDIVNYDDARFRPRIGYDLFIGHGGINFEQIAWHLDPSCITICFSTGSYWKLHNERAQIRADDLCRRRRVSIAPDRLITHSEEWANANADGIIALGNSRVRQSYARFPRVTNLNNAVCHDRLFDPARKDLANGRTRFLFFAGSGNVHKGLDLLLEAFSGIKPHLYICQALSPVFTNAYRRELSTSPNIHYIGPVTIRNRRFYELVSLCNFVILPSCSEGQPGSVLDCMHYGLIPIVSKESNIDTDDFGVTLKNCSIEEIKEVVQELSSRPQAWQEEVSARSQMATLDCFSPETFRENFAQAIVALSEPTQRCA